MENNEILTRIESLMPFLSKSEQKLGNYILTHPKDVTDMSTSALSQACDISEPTLIRFTRRLGFQGYKDFKLHLSANFISNQIDSTPVKVNLNDSAIEIYRKLASFTINSLNSTLNTLDANDLENAANYIYVAAKQNNLNDSAIEIYRKLASFTINSLNSTLNTLDANDLENAANYIYVAAKQNRKIFLSGMGASTVLIHEFQIKMMRLNIQTIFFEDIHLRLEACANLKKNDLFICFTTLGASKENYELIDIAHERKAKIIVITQFGNSQIAEKADIALYTSIIENNLRLASQTSIILQAHERKAKIIVITQFGNSQIAEKADIALYTSIIENNLRLASQTSIILQSMVIDVLFLTIACKDYASITNSVKDFREKFKQLGHLI